MAHAGFKRVKEFCGGSKEEYVDFRDLVEGLVGSVYGAKAAEVVISARASPMTPIVQASDLAHGGDAADAIADMLFMLNYVLLKEPKKILTNSNKNLNTHALDAWRKLEFRYNNRTIQHDIADLKGLNHPSPVKHVSEVMSRIELWESEVRELSEANQAILFAPQMRISLVRDMCPADLRQHLEDKNLESWDEM